MKINELRKELEQFPDDTEVYLYNDTFEDRRIVPVTSVYPILSEGHIERPTIAVIE